MIVDFPRRRFHRLAAALLVASACASSPQEPEAQGGTGGEPDCPEVANTDEEVRILVYGTVEGFGGGGGAPGTQLDVSGEVVAADAADAGLGLPVVLGVGWPMPIVRSAEFIDDATGQTLQVGWGSPGAPGVLVGDRIRVTGRLAPRTASHPGTDVQLTIEANGRPLVWAGSGPPSQLFAPGGVRFDTGEHLCGPIEAEGTNWDYFELVARVSGSPPRVVLGQFEAAGFRWHPRGGVAETPDGKHAFVGAVALP